MIKTNLFLIILAAFIVGCQNNLRNNTNQIQKIKDTDKFKNTIVESSYYTISIEEDNVITNNSFLIIVPKGSLIDRNGKGVTDSVQIELAKAEDIDEYILSNLMIQDTNKIYESYLSFFINATQNGKQLFINPQNPVYIEVSADKKIDLYHGIRDDFGDMNWDSTLLSVDYLFPVPLESLDFYPDNFEVAAEKGLPFRNHEIVNKEFLDSLYYSFSTEIDEEGYFKWTSRLGIINLITPLVNLIAQEDDLLDEMVLGDTAVSPTICGINPASIKAIKNKTFQNTLISTREFENRLKYIFATCDNNVLELYIKNLDKNIWEIDEMAADLLGASHVQYSKFKEFASYKQTNIKISDRKADALARYYKQTKENIEKELIKQKKDFLKQVEKRNEIELAKKKEYRDLLERRLNYRMQKFGFELTNFGWYNAAHNIKLKQLETFEIDIKVENGSKFDRTYVYAVNPRIKSIFSFLASDLVHFNMAYAEDPILLLWKDQEFNIIGVGYKEENIGYNIIKVIQQPVMNLDLKLNASNIKEFKADLKEFTRGYNKENKIIVDLEYQAFFYKEKKRKEKELQEKKYIMELRKTVFPCCDLSYDPDAVIEALYLE